jgi:hypothetical protein
MAHGPPVGAQRQGAEHSGTASCVPRDLTVRRPPRQDDVRPGGRRALEHEPVAVHRPAGHVDHGAALDEGHVAGPGPAQADVVDGTQFCQLVREVPPPEGVGTGGRAPTERPVPRPLGAGRQRQRGRAPTVRPLAHARTQLDPAADREQLVQGRAVVRRQLQGDPVTVTTGGDHPDERLVGVQAEGAVPVDPDAGAAESTVVAGRQLAGRGPAVHVRHRRLAHDSGGLDPGPELPRGGHAGCQRGQRGHVDARGEPGRAEVGPLVTADPGQVVVGRGLRGDRHGPRPVLRAEGELDDGPVRRQVDGRDVGPAGHLHDVARGPPSATDGGDELALGGRELVPPGRPAGARVVVERQRDEDPAVGHGRRPGVESEPALADELPGPGPVVGQDQVVERPGLDVDAAPDILRDELEQPGDAVDQETPVLLAGRVDLAQRQPEVVDEQLPRARLEDVAGGVLAQRLEAGERSAEALLEVPLGRDLLGDGGVVLPHPPVVQGVGENVERRRLGIGLGRHGLVLVEHALLEPQSGGVPERPPVDLAPGDGVDQDTGELAQGHPGTWLGVDLPDPVAGGPGPLAVHAPVAHHGEVRARTAQRLHDDGDRPPGDAVVGVDEGQVLPRGSCDPGVARRAQAGIGLTDDPDPPVTSPGVLRDRETAVGRAVVHHDDLDVQVRLVGDAAQALRQVGLDVVDRYHDADLRRAGEGHRAERPDTDVDRAPCGLLHPGRRRAYGMAEHAHGRTPRSPADRRPALCAPGAINAGHARSAAARRGNRSPS